jgi:hypothetical protein
MELIASNGQHSTIRLSNSELMLINNALNEVANGIDIADTEFHTRLGASRLEARQLLTMVGECLSEME